MTAPRYRRALGLEDAAPVVTEPFTQWVIEDRFARGLRPDWSIAGAEFVSDVAPYENMKLRLLNGSHSTLAYLGYLAGYETVSDTMRDANYRRLAQAVMDDAATTLKMPPGADVAAYKRALLERYENPALRHRTWQICMDGSQKLPQRLLGTIRDRLAAGAPIDRLVMGVAGWMRYVTGIDEQGKPIDVRDPLSARLRAICGQGRTRSPTALPLPCSRCGKSSPQSSPPIRASATPLRVRSPHHREGREGSRRGAENLSRVRGARLRDQCGDRGLVERFHERRDAAPDGPVELALHRRHRRVRHDLIERAAGLEARLDRADHLPDPDRARRHREANAAVGPADSLDETGLAQCLDQLEDILLGDAGSGRDRRDLGERRMLCRAIGEHVQRIASLLGQSHAVIPPV